MAPGHAASGALAGAVTAPLVLPDAPLLVIGLYIAVATVAALMPDLDHPHSRLTKALGPITWLVSKLFVWSAKAVLEATRGPDDPKRTNGHRMLWHQVEPAAALAALVGFGVSLSPAHGLAWPVAVAVCVGMCAHICGDCCTHAGVPFSLTVVLIRGALGCEERWKHYGIPRCLRFETGGKFGEPVTTAVLGVGAVVAAVWLLPGAGPYLLQLAR